MLINLFLSNCQKLLNPIYNKSIFLQNIDWLIFLNIILVVVTSAFLPSDNIGYFAIFTILLTAIKFLVKPNEKFSLTGPEIFLLIYFLIVIVSVAGSSLLLLSIKGFCKTLIYLGFYVALVHYLKNNKDKIKYILLAIALTVFFESIIALKQNFMSVAEISGWQDMSRLNPEEVMTRVYGTLKPYNPNLFGGYLLSTLSTMLILVALPLMNKHYKTAMLGLCLFIFSSVVLFMTGCRGAYIGYFAESVALICITYRYLKPYYKKMFTVLSLLFSSAVLTIILSISSLRARVFSIFAMRGDSSNSFRFNVYNSCIEMFKDNWLLGIGVGNQNFREIYGLYMRTGFDALSAYNIYLEIAVESGIFALITFLMFLFGNLYNAIRYILKYINANSIYLSIAVISIIGMLVHGIVDTVFFRPQIQFIFWIMVAIIRVITSPRRTYARKRS